MIKTEINLNPEKVKKEVIINMSIFFEKATDLKDQKLKKMES